MPLPELKDRIVFISGAASGIGAATARAFSRRGCQLVLADLDLVVLTNIENSLAQTGARVSSVMLDVSDEAQYTEIAQEIRKTVGIPHVVVNNVDVGAHGSFLNAPMKAVRRIIDINLYGVSNGCHAFLPMMLGAGDHRHLFNVASMTSISPMPDMPAYAASKYAVDGLTEVLAMKTAVQIGYA